MRAHAAGAAVMRAVATITQDNDTTVATAAAQVFRVVMCEHPAHFLSAQTHALGGALYRQRFFMQYLLQLSETIRACTPMTRAYPLLALSYMIEPLPLSVLMGHHQQVRQ